jgi:hypothetical protein
MLELLLSFLALMQIQPAAEKPRPVIHHGSSNRHVLYLERRLHSLGYLREQPNRDFNLTTQAAVWALQGDLGLERDGAVGSKTWQGLLSAKTRARPYRPVREGVVVDLTRGNIQIVSRGRVRHTIHTASGSSATPTVQGDYRIYHRVRDDWSRQYNSSMPYAQYFYRGYAFHESSSVPAYPASHGCLRLRNEDAKYLWDTLDYGDRVIVMASNGRSVL